MKPIGWAIIATLVSGALIVMFTKKWQDQDWADEVLGDQTLWREK